MGIVSSSSWLNAIDWYTFLQNADVSRKESAIEISFVGQLYRFDGIWIMINADIRNTPCFVPAKELSDNF